jgi:hypothetical protein
MPAIMWKTSRVAHSRTSFHAGSSGTRLSVARAGMGLRNACAERGDAFFDLLGGEGLAEIIFGSGGEGFDYVCFAAFGGDHDYGNVFGCGDGGESFEELEAVHYGHVDVAEDGVEGAFLNFEEGFGSVAGFQGFAEVEAGLAEGAFDDSAYYGGVVDDQDF